MKSVRKRLTYANVMSSLAVFLVVAGGAAFAAVELGKESVGTKQLAKEAVSLAKIKKSTKNALKGATGPAGAVGAKGSTGSNGAKGDRVEKGETGERGPSAAKSASVEGNEQLGIGESAALAVTSVSLPAGNFVLVGETTLTNLSGAPRSAWCSLNAGSQRLGLTRGFDEAATTQRSTDATVIGSVSLASPGTVVLKCWASASNVYTPATSMPALQAIQVGSLN